jgi:hypothetical protein
MLAFNFSGHGDPPLALALALAGQAIPLPVPAVYADGPGLAGRSGLPPVLAGQR